MKIVEAGISSTHIDAHGDMMSLEALEGVVEQLAECYVPINLEHDIRIPPIGRIAGGRVVPTADGEYLLVGVQQIFEVGDTLEDVTSDSRKIVKRDSTPTTLRVEYDRWFNSPAGRSILDHLAELSSEPPKELIKKSVDPISVIGLAVGVLDLFKPVAISLFDKLRHNEIEQLQQIVLADIPLVAADASVIVDTNFEVYFDKHELEVHILVDTRDKTAAKRLFWPLTRELRERLERLPIVAMDICRTVFALDGERLVFRYALRSDGAPLAFVDGVPTLITLAEVREDGVHIAAERLKLYDEDPDS